MTDVDVLPSDTSWLSEPTTGVHQFGGVSMGPQNLKKSLKLFSETDAFLIEIVRNEWISGDPLPWDIEADWQTLTLRERNRKISIFVNARTVPMRLRGEFWRSGKAIVIDKNGILVRGQSALGL